MRYTSASHPVVQRIVTRVLPVAAGALLVVAIVGISLKRFTFLPFGIPYQPTEWLATALESTFQELTVTVNPHVGLLEDRPWIAINRCPAAKTAGVVSSTGALIIE